MDQGTQAMGVQRFAHYQCPRVLSQASVRLACSRSLSLERGSKSPTPYDSHWRNTPVGSRRGSPAAGTVGGRLPHAAADLHCDAAGGDAGSYTACPQGIHNAIMPTALCQEACKVKARF